MRILLVNPPNCGRNIIQEEYGIDVIRETFRGPPLSLEVIAGPLRSESVEIFDMKADQCSFAEKLKEFEPDVVGVTCMTCEANTALKLCRQAKDHRSGMVTVVGGVHATNDPGFFDHRCVDYVVLGVGQKTFADLIRRLQAGAPPAEAAGLGVQSGGKLHLTPKRFTKEDFLADVLPNRELVRKYRKAYHLNNVPLVLDFVETAYGCTNRCDFCCLWQTTGGRYLPKEPEHVARDVAQTEAFVVRLVDANTLGDPKRARQLARLLDERGIFKLFIADVRADTAARDPELIRIWRRAGLKMVVVGFEEISDSQLARYNKRTTREINTRAIEVFHDHGIDVIGDFIVSPDYDQQDFDKLAEYVAQNKIEFPGFSVLTPLPGTSLYEQYKDRITIHDLDYYTLTNAVVRTRLPEDVFYDNLARLFRRFHCCAAPLRLLARLLLREPVVKVVHTAHRWMADFSDRLRGSTPAGQ